MLNNIFKNIIYRNKKLLINISSYTTISIINGVFNFLFISYYARILPLEQMGIIGLILAVTYITVPASKFGTTELVGINAINYPLRKFINFFNDLNTFTLYTIPFLALIAILTTLYFDQNIYFAITIIVFSYVRTYIGLSDKILITKRKIKVYACEKIKTSILTLIFGVVFVQIYFSWMSYFAAIILAELISCLYRYKRSFRFIDIKNNWSEFKYFLNYGLPYMIGLGGAWILNQFDKIIVEKNFGIEILGGYALAYQIGVILRTFNTAIINAIYPDLYNSFKRGKYLKIQVKYFLLFFCINILLICLLLIFVKYLFIKVYGIKYEKFTYVVIFIGLSLLFEGFYKVWDSLITYLKKNFAKTIILYLSSFIGIIFSLIFIPIFEYVAPSIGVLFAYLFLFIMSLLYSIKLSKQ